jgi:hypothetical protein
MSNKASNNFTVYLNDELAQRVKDSDRNDLKTIAKDAIVRALNGDVTQPDSQDTPSPAPAEYRADMSEIAAALGMTAVDDVEWPTTEQILTAIADQNEIHRNQWRVVIENVGLDPEATNTLEHIVAAITALRENSQDLIAAAAPLLLTPDTIYDTVWAESSIELQARLDNIHAQGGRPQSVAPDTDGRYLLLIAWPQGTDEDPGD